MGKDAEVARALGRGDWRKVIELESAALDEEEYKQFSYAMIGMAYENLPELDNAKLNYAKAIEIDERCQQALEGLSRLYFNEKNYDIAYYYAHKGLHAAEEFDYSVPRYAKIVISVIIKILRPSRPYKEIRAETQEMDQSRNKWKKWATEFTEWYEQSNKQNEKPKVH